MRRLLDPADGIEQRLELAMAKQIRRIAHRYRERVGDRLDEQVLRVGEALIQIRGAPGDPHVDHRPGPVSTRDEVPHRFRHVRARAAGLTSKPILVRIPRRLR